MYYSRQWVIRHPDFSARDRLVESVGISPVVASVLVNRGITEEDEVRAFLKPSLKHLHDPFLMKDMDKAASRLQKAVVDKERVLVYGDFDVDGIVSATLVRDFLRIVGIDCEAYIPDRLTEGYGVNDFAVP
ncbi:MAG: hypothetical protein U5N86_10680 [Planctomycetota bacterium]|nr:hypothetical protein [Planctomycetota bacterium]